MDLFDSLERNKPIAPAPKKPDSPKVSARKLAGAVAAPCGPISPVMVAPQGPGDREIVGTLRVGDDCVYWSLYSGHFLAKVTAVRSIFGQVDVNIYGDSGKWILHRTRVPLMPQASAYPDSVYVGERPRQ